eukprot:CAMPEP_0119152574 /NCGR_PEP_ID=MMETSP1310-20130426/48000_1 /TAXON_ID=464262 /ORGANISM="Genus nov. species nov., Strain RCC2339" /LENGTH=103 /DNA_ID=CAMNT_0007144955 /DNA_START=98 /DNA_END=406 /DNA_ORIENTATION=-
MADEQAGQCLAEHVLGKTVGERVEEKVVREVRAVGSDGVEVRRDTWDSEMVQDTTLRRLYDEVVGKGIKALVHRFGEDIVNRDSLCTGRELAGGVVSATFVRI